MARDYLAFPATSVSSERLFSSGGIMISDRRYYLAPKTIRASQCLKSLTQGLLKDKLDF